MPYRSDNWIPEYLKNITVDGTSTYSGPATELSGATAVVVQLNASNGAAGMIYVDGSCQAGKGAKWMNMTSNPVSANGTTYVSYNANDALTNMYQMRVRFVSSAAGTINVIVNMRMTSAL